MSYNLNRRLRNFSNLFKKKKFTPQLLDNKYRVVLAFEYGGVRYFQFDSQFECPTGRQMAALAIYTEMGMNCDKEYLTKHCRAMEKLLSDPKKINIQAIAQININLKERLELMPLPDFIYKLASVVFFDDQESPYNYDYAYAEKKIARWKESGDVLSFFFATPLKELIPYSRIAESDSRMYLEVASQIDKTHQRDLTGVLSGKG